MSAAASRTSDLVSGFSAGCERLIRPDVIGEKERSHQRRFIGVMLAAPFIGAGVVAQGFAASTGAAATLAFVCLLFGISWLATLVVAATAGWRGAGLAVLAAAAPALGFCIAAAGGASSPFSLLAAAFAIEAHWVSRSRRATLAGAGAGAAALVLAAGLPTGGAAASAWHWLPVLAYAATVLTRLDGFAGQADQDTIQASGPRLDEISDVVLVTLNGAGEVQTVSERARDLLGVPPQMLLGASFFERVHLADRVGYLSALADLREGAARVAIEARLRLPAEGEPAGSFRLFSIEFTRTGEGEFVAVLRDIGEVERLRALLGAARDEADGSEVAKSRFLAAVSHELRTPLNAIIGFSDMLVHEMFGPFADPRQREYAGLIRDSGNHLLSVVNSILDVSKIEAGTYPIRCEGFEFRDAARMCISMLQLQAAEKSLDLLDEVQASAGEVRADRRAVQQILINLVSNAVKFTPEGGKVSIGARRVGEQLRFWVSDTGIGIAESDLARLGKPFMQVQNDYTRQFEGTGLGLALVKGLVALHDGSMAIESAPGLGTTVTISLPAAGPARDEAAWRGHMPRVKANGGHDGAIRKTA